MSSFREAFNWHSNPFSFMILPNLFVGYSKERDLITNSISNADKFTLLLGPTGSGKTTLLRHLIPRFADHYVIFLPKPPKNPEDWVGIFSCFTKKGLLSSLLKRGDKPDLYNLSEKINSCLKEKRCILFVDEGHEATQESLEWLRTITDQVNNMTVVLAGLPIFENVLKETLETFLRRITLRVDLGCLSMMETREFIKKRIESVGGEDIKPFTSPIIEHIHEQTGGFPREVLKLCNELAQKALEKGITTIDSGFLEETDMSPRVSVDTLETLPQKQKLIVDTLMKEGELTPTELVAKLQATGEYKDQDNAIRSVNNLVRRLMSDGFLERKRFGKAYRYKISPRYQTLLVNA